VHVWRRVALALAAAFGVADYALTYVGYILFDNAIGATASLVNGGT
jgi:hypothetical protein